jgi:hypothetical protein
MREERRVSSSSVTEFTDQSRSQSSSFVDRGSWMQNSVATDTYFGVGEGKEGYNAPSET